MSKRFVYYNAGTLGSRPFIIKVNSGADSQFTIPTNSLYTYNFDVITSDGQTFSSITGNQLINFSDANTDYIIEISGVFPHWNQNNNAEKLKVLDVMQWGTIQWLSFEYSYGKCYNWRSSANDIPDTKLVEDFSHAFRETDFNSSISLWDFSSTKDMFAILYSCNLYTKDIVINDTIKGTISLELLGYSFTSVESKVLKLYAEELNTIDTFSFQAMNSTEVLEFNEMSISFNVEYFISLVGTELNNLANSVKDMTGLTSPTLTMTVAQYGSTGFTPALFTNKNWTISQV